MAVNGSDIQVENGNFSRIHNAILEQLARTDFNGRELRCLLYLLRMTYGFQRKEYGISLSDWNAGTDISRSNIPGVLRRLTDRNIIVKTDNGNRKPPTWAFNKYYEQWDKPAHSGKGFGGIHVDTTQGGIDVDTTSGIDVDTRRGIDVDTTSGIPLQCATTHIKDSIKDSPKNNCKDTLLSNDNTCQPALLPTNGNGTGKTEKPKTKPKAERSDKQKELDAWVEAFAFALEGDTALRSVANMYRGWVKEFEAAGYVPEDVRVWKEQRWPLDWRFEKGQKPSRGALTAGLPEVRKRREHMEAKARPTPPKMLGVVNIDGKRMQILKHADGREELKEIVEVTA